MSTTQLAIDERDFETIGNENGAGGDPSARLQFARPSALPEIQISSERRFSLKLPLVCKHECSPTDERVERPSGAVAGTREFISRIETRAIRRRRPWQRAARIETKKPVACRRFDPNFILVSADYRILQLRLTRLDSLTTLVVRHESNWRRGLAERLRVSAFRINCFVLDLNQSMCFCFSSRYNFLQTAFFPLSFVSRASGRRSQSIRTSQPATSARPLIWPIE